MKKISILTILCLALIALCKNQNTAQSIVGWFKSGSKSKSYEVGFDKNNI
jgi:hypothetical protein